MRTRTWLALLSVALTASSCPPQPGPPAATPTLVNIGGYGRWIKATATKPDTFGFSVRPAEDVCPAATTISFQTCPARYPDTAFIDFSIPTNTWFEVSSNGTMLTEVSQTATMGDFQYRKVAIVDGSAPPNTWRIAVSVPSMGRTWCPPARFPVDIVDVSSGQPARSAPLHVMLDWGYCQSETTIMWYSTGTTGTPSTPSPPTPAPDCPGGGFSRAFNVCQTCAAGGIPFPATFWGCSLADAQAKMQWPGCTSVQRTGVNC